MLSELKPCTRLIQFDQEINASIHFPILNNQSLIIFVKLYIFYQEHTQLKLANEYFSWQKCVV